MAWKVYDYPDPPNEPDMPTCPDCGDDMTDEVYMVDHEWICADCFRKFIADFSTEELADAFGYRHQELKETEALWD